MKTPIRFILLASCLITGLVFAETERKPAIFPEEDPQTPENYRLVWPTTPGIRYEVRQSTNLQSWTVSPGYPATAAGPAQQMPS